MKFLKTDSIKISLIIATLIALTHGINAQKKITGKVIDIETLEGLPFATIAIGEQSSGTVSNGDGEFELVIPDAIKFLKISYLGYSQEQINITSNFNDIRVKLTPQAIQLDELVIRPLSPTDYIKISINRIPENYPTVPFSTVAYYRQKFTENDQFINFTEAIFSSYYPSYQDTVENQHQLLLYNQADELHDIVFMKEKRDKKEEKNRRKAIRKGKEPEDVDEDFIEGEFGGPEEVLSQDIIKEKEPFLDSTQFNKYTYKFGGASSYQGRELLVIDFESRRKVEHMIQQGKIYIDTKTDAFAAIEYDAEVKIPVVIKPILIAFGISIDNPKFEKKLRYRFTEEQWIPENIQWNAKIGITKTYLFKKNETSNFFIEQVFTITESDFFEINPIPETQRFIPDEPMREQVFNDSNLNWSDFNVIKPEELLVSMDEDNMQ